MNGRTVGRRHLPTSRPWFYPVVEQHDVTYHRVKPLTWHRRQRHNAKPNRNKMRGKKIKIKKEQKHGKQKKWQHITETWRTAEGGWTGWGRTEMLEEEEEEEEGVLHGFNNIYIRRTRPKTQMLQLDTVLWNKNEQRSLIKTWRKFRFGLRKII